MDGILISEDESGSADGTAFATFFNNSPWDLKPPSFFIFYCTTIIIKKLFLKNIYNKLAKDIMKIL